MNFDSNKFARAIEKTGLAPDAADAFIEALDETRAGLTTAAQLDQMEHKIMSNVDVITSRFEMSITKLISEQKTAQVQEIAKLTTEFHSTIYKAAGIIISSIGIMLTIFHFWK